jgi:dipeptidyl aminopeptidase/acylaminoacyl peptidase
MSLPPLIPRSVLFGAPARLYPALSPDGARVAYVGPLDGIPNIWVQTIGKADARPVTADAGGINAFDWAMDGQHILYPQDGDGDGNTHVFAVEVATGRVRDLTPGDGIRARFLAVEPTRPHHVLFSMSQQGQQSQDLCLADLRTGSSTVIAENTGFAGWLHDRQLRARCAFRWRDDGGLTIVVRDPGGPWRTLHTVDAEDSTNTRAVGFTHGGHAVAVLSSSDANTVRLLRIDVTTGVTKVSYEDPEYDVEGVSLSPITGEADLVVVHRERRRLEAVDPTLDSELAQLRASCAGDAVLLGRLADDSKWLIMDYVADGPATYSVYDRHDRRFTELFNHNPVLADYTLAPVEPFSFAARDGLIVHGYLTFPVGLPRHRLPTVLAVHGGPWSRDAWGTGGDAQWLANRGYLSVQVNFRGSTGYGKKFVNAGNREWGGRMQDDLTDAARWLVARGHADPDRLAIYGSSYGGYAALVGATFTPDLYRAAIAVCAPVNLRTFVTSALASSGQQAPRIRGRIGDPLVDGDFLWSRSPLSRVDELRIPVLVAHGAKDPRVPRTEAEQIVAALRDRAIPHEYLLFPDEGHGFMKPKNRIAFYAAAERFLSEHLGGRDEI